MRQLANERYDSTSVKSNSKKGDWEGVKIVAQNRAASYNYTLLDKLEAGLILVGTEVKSLREGKGTLRDAYAEIRARRRLARSTATFPSICRAACAITTRFGSASCFSIAAKSTG